MYLTYEEYRERGGTLPQARFPAAELRARGRVDALTAGRVGRMDTVPEAVKLAMMSAIRADGAVGADAQADAPMVAAFSTDGYSERYGGAAERTGVVEAQLAAELKRLLLGLEDDDGVPLLYRGI